MYNVKGPSRIVAKTTTRRGISQKLDNYQNRNKTFDEQTDRSSLPKPVFYKKSPPGNHRHRNISPQHEEIINFVYESWSSVCAELEPESGDSDESACTQSEHSTCYYEDEPCTLPDFKPFDLESWWGKRLYAIITNSVNKS